MTRIILVGLLGGALQVQAAVPDVIKVDTRTGKASAPALFGAFFEEVNHAGEGGLYGELIYNRSFEEALPVEGTQWQAGISRAPASPHYVAGTNRNWSVRWSFPSPWPGWSLEGPAAARARLSIETTSPVHPRNTNYLRLNLGAGATGPAMLLNSGFWGVPVRAGEPYQLSFYARAAANSPGADIRAGFISETGEVLGSVTIPQVNSPAWKQYTATFQARAGNPKAQFFIQPLAPAVLDLDVVSVFPRETFRSRPNGVRRDLGQYLADLKPAFLKFPGGCAVEGVTMANRYRWKETLGPVEQRPGHWNVWSYRNTDGLGYHEFLQLCEDIGAQAMYVCNAGISCEFRNGDYLPEDQLQEVINDVLDAVEYALGGPETRWGAERARHGHPAKFPLRYVEIGNEHHGAIYEKHYNRIASALRQRWPGVELIYNAGIRDLQPGKGAANIDLLDEHYYGDPAWFFANANRFDKAPQNRGFHIYVGEFACNRGVGSGNLLGALAESAFMLGMERNPQLVRLSSYAPLLGNANKVDWPVSLIHFDAARSFGRSSYYAQKLLAENRGDVVVNCQVEDRNPGLTPAFAGAIGLCTWDTDAEFRNLSVETGGKIVYRPDFASSPGWAVRSGQWTASKGSLFVRGGANRRAAIYDRFFLENGVIRLQARKLSGPEGFQVIFGETADGNYHALNLGGWKNTRNCFLYSQAGAGRYIGEEAAMEPIETNRWYDVRVEIRNGEVIGFLDGKLVARATRIPDSRLVAGASVDRARGEVIVKVVNATETKRSLSLDLKGATPKGNGRKITLAGAHYTDENTLDSPLKVVPRESPFLAEGSSLQTEVQPWSLTVFRFPAEL